MIEYGSSFLSKDAIDWQLDKAFMSQSNISIAGGGSAIFDITKELSNGVKEAYKIVIIANKYDDTYAPVSFICLDVLYENNTWCNVKIPLVDTGSNKFEAVIPMTVGAFTSFTFKIVTDTALVIAEWYMASPLTDYQQDIADAKEEIPKLLYDYNTSSYEITTEESSIGLITCELLENTDLNGHIELTYNAPRDLILTLRLRDNDIQELYTPIVYNLKAGKGSIGIPHAYLKKYLGIHTFALSAQINTGTMTIVTRGTLCTIDGGHMVRRLMDIDVEITDMTIRQMVNETTPSRIYAVGMEDGMARVRYRPFKGDASVAWTPEYEVGPATDAAIEFNGYWIDRTADEGYSIVTDEAPYVFWTDADSKLFAQRGLEEETLMELASGATSLSAVRGFKSMEVVGQDQGLIIAYIRNGAVYYRAYCEQSIGGYVWENEHQLAGAGTGNTAVNIVRLNDYRICFAVSNPAGNKLFITDRTYVGLAVKSERISMFDTSITTLYVEYMTEHKPRHNEYIETTDEYISFTMEESQWDIALPNLISFESTDADKTITMNFDVPLFGMDNSIIDRITILPENTITSILQTDSNTIVVTFANTVSLTTAMKFNMSHCYTAGFIRNGKQFLGDGIWDIAFVPAKHDITEEIEVIDTELISFEYTIPVERMRGAKDVYVLVTETTISNVALIPIGTIPI